MAKNGKEPLFRGEKEITHETTPVSDFLQHTQQQNTRTCTVAFHVI